MKLLAKDCARLFGRLVIRPDGCWGFLQNGEMVNGRLAAIEWDGHTRKVRTVLKTYFGRPQHTRACAFPQCVIPTHVRVRTRRNSLSAVR